MTLIRFSRPNDWHSFRNGFQKVDYTSFILMLAVAAVIMFMVSRYSQR